MLLTFIIAQMLAFEPPQDAALSGAADPPPAADVGRGPQPALNPISWEFKINFEDPQAIEVGGRRYWHMLYIVTNTSDRTQNYFPKIQIVTEDLKVIDADVGVPPGVFNAVRDLHKKRYAYLVSAAEAIGDLRSGDDYARESVAVWRELDAGVNRFSIFFGGLSGEAYAVKNPAYEPRPAGDSKLELEITPGGATKASFDHNPKFFTLRKTLEITYAMPGSPEARGASQPVRTRVRWVMR